MIIQQSNTILPISLSFSFRRDFFIYSFRKRSEAVHKTLYEIVSARRSRSFIRNCTMWRTHRYGYTYARRDREFNGYIPGSHTHITSTRTHTNVLARSEVVTARCPVSYCHLPPYAKERERERETPTLPIFDPSPAIPLRGRDAG